MILTKKNKSLILFNAVFLFLIILLLGVELKAETIFFKSGKIIKGRIISQTTTVLTLKDRAGKQRYFRTNTILRINYTNVYLGKVIIKMTNGDTLEVFIVAEEQLFYTYRFKLFSKKEYKVKRSDVMFLTRKDPTGLTGIATPTKIMVKWNKPFGRVKKYIVYIKSPGAKIFKLYSTTNDTNIIIESLLPKKKYVIRVTAVDPADYESNPSNEFVVTTGKIPPLPPERKYSIVKSDKKNGTRDIYFYWNEAIDPDGGGIIGYDIYQIKSGKNVKIDSTKSTSYIVKGKFDERIKKYYIVSKDDDGLFSSGTFFDTRYRQSFEFTIAGIFVLPIGELSKIFGVGFGGTLNFFMNDIWVYNFRMGFTTGFLYFTGANSNYNEGFLAPFQVTLSRTFYYGKSIIFTPKIGIGGVVTSLTYSEDYYVLLNDDLSQTSFGVAPLLSAGFEISYSLNEQIYFTCSGEYSTFVKRQLPLPINDNYNSQ